MRMVSYAIAVGVLGLALDQAPASAQTGFRSIVDHIQIVTEPRPLTLPSGTTMRLAFIEGPDGVRVELVQRN